MVSKKRTQRIIIIKAKFKTLCLIKIETFFSMEGIIMKIKCNGLGDKIHNT